MPMVMECPNTLCGKSLKVNKALSAGASLRCPHCQQVFKFAGAKPPPLPTTEIMEEATGATRSFAPSETQDYPSARAAKPAKQDAISSLSPETRSLAGTATPPQAPTQPAKLKAIGRFQIRRLLGEGAFGKVYEAYDPQLDRPVALKVAKGDLVSSEERAKRFVREAKAAANLRHPNIVPIFEFGRDGPHFYIALAFIEGKPLDKLLKKHQPVPFDMCVPWIRGLAAALAYAHGQGIVHRDVKPANVLLDERGEPMLADFGLAAREEEAEKLTHAGAVLGTPLYMSPEQARGQEGSAQPASDQYSLGVMLYQMLTGRPPFEGSVELVMLHHQEQEPTPPRKLNGAIPRDLDTICLKCLEKEPARRYADCQALADDLRRWQEGEAIQARRIGTWERIGRWCRRNPVEAGLALLVALSLIAGATFSAYFALQENKARDAADLSAKHANEQKTLAEKNEGIAKEQSQRAEENALIATQQAKRAEENADKAGQEAEKARRESEKARRESQKAKRVSGFLVGLFDAVDPVGLTGYAFGPDPKHGGKLLAKDVLERGVSKVRVELKDEPETRATVLMTIGSVLRSMGQYKDARPLLEEALKIRQGLVNVPPAEVAESWFHLGWLHHQAGDDLDGMHCYREAMKLVQDAPGHEDLVSQCEFNIAWLLAQQDANEPAAKLFRKVLAERKQRLGAGHYDVAVAQAGLASVLFQMQKQGEAIMLVVPALQTFRKAHGDESMATAAGLAQEAMLAAGVFNIRDAEAKMIKVVSLAKNRLGDNHPFVAWALGLTGEMLSTAGRKKEGMQYFAQSLQVCRDGMGLDHVMVLRAVHRQANLLAGTGDPEAGCKLYEEMLQQVRSRKGEAHFLLALVLDDYGEYVAALKRPQAAEALFRQAVEVDRKVPDGQRIKRIKSRIHLVGLVWKRDAAEAEKLLHEEVKIRNETKHGQEEIDAQTIGVWCDLAFLLIKQKQYSAAAPWVQKLNSPAVDILKLPKDLRDLALHLKKTTPSLLLEEGRLQASFVGQAAYPSADIVLGAVGAQLMQLHLSQPAFDITTVKAPQVIWEVDGALTPDSPKDRLRKTAFSQIYPATLEAGSSYQIDLMSSQFDAFLRLEDPHGKLLAQNDDGGGKLNARILYAPKQTVLVHIIATTFGAKNTGAFKIVHQRLEERQEIVTKTFVLRKADRLTKEDPVDPRAKQQRAKAYTLVLEAGTEYQFDLTSDDFDPFLRLEDEAGRALASDDDSGFDLNARIRYRPLRTGTYRIVVTTFNPAELGEFVLSVRK